ncbi:MAG: cysteine peptidase family C39 domain-containing protein [Byssovorax sp.]
MVRQELPMSCGAACARQLLLDAGIDVPEATIRERAGFHPELGILLDSLEEVLNELHSGALYKAGAVLPEGLPQLGRVVPFIALLRTPSRHIVIVDQITASNVTLRDPGGTPGGPGIGACGLMDKEMFVERWTRAYNGVLFRRE